MAEYNNRGGDSRFNSAAGKTSYGGKPKFDGARGAKPAYAGKPAYSGKPAYAGKPSYGAKASFGGKPAYAGKPAFAKKSWSDERPTTLHKATCASCSAACEVPFRPISGKPVYCKNCFVKSGDTATQGRAGDRFPKRDFVPRQSDTARYEAPRANDSAVLKQLENMNIKLERLTAAVELLTGAKPATVADEAEEEIAKATKKVAKKKTAKKSK